MCGKNKIQKKEELENVKQTICQKQISFDHKNVDTQIPE